jgi:hypothetical protein
MFGRARRYIAHRSVPHDMASRHLTNIAPVELVKAMQPRTWSL